MGEKNENSVKICKDNRSDDESASHFALQIALQTMKERCQLLQQRLSAVEDENLRLRIETQNNNRKSRDGVPASEINKLEEKITQLSRQKCQLIDRITMVAKENNQLWTRLSRVTEANQSLGNHLSKISDTLNKHPVGDANMKAGDTEAIAGDEEDSKLCPEGKKEESLEEISLKIIDTYRREKRVLEQQCEEMVELQTVEECGFTLTANGDIASGIIESDSDYENVMDDIKRVREKMAEGYKTVRDQQAGLQAAIASLNILVAEKKNCKCKCVPSEESSRATSKNCESSGQVMTMSTMILPLNDIEKHLKDVAEPPETDSADAPSSEHHLVEPYSDNVTENNKDDRICPLCGKFYSHKVDFDDFHDHVLSHFANDSQEDESIINNFEVIT